MPEIENKELYEKIKKKADEIYKKPSAYKSGFIVKEYKKQGGIYKDDKKPKELKRWFKESWGSIGGEYPTYRPFKRINKKTPLTANEIDPTQAKKQIELKQIIKGEKNLPPFLPNKEKEILDFSDPKKVYKKAQEYLGKNVDIRISNLPKKKYMVFNPSTEKWVHFGQMGYEDFTHHKDPIRRRNYLNRTLFMKGDWKNNKYSPNNLSRNILW